MNILAPYWSGHDGPDHLRITSPVGATKKINNQGTGKLHERDENIRAMVKGGTTVSEVSCYYNLKTSTVYKILGEGVEK